MNLPHLKSEELVDYFVEKWTEDQQSAMECHLAECGPCSELAGRIYEEAFRMDEWTTRRFGAATPAEAAFVVLGPAMVR